MVGASLVGRAGRRRQDVVPGEDVGGIGGGRYVGHGGLVEGEGLSLEPAGAAGRGGGNRGGEREGLEIERNRGHLYASDWQIQRFAVKVRDPQPFNLCRNCERQMTLITWEEREPRE